MNSILKKIKNRVINRSDVRKFLLDKMPKDSVCAEIGAWEGDFSERILQVVTPKKLYLIDPYQYVSEYQNALFGGQAGSQAKMDAVHDGVLKRFAVEIANGQVEMVRNASVKGLESFADHTFDWVYIDGNHKYEFVKDDLNASWKKTKIGGFITGDDYDIEGWWENGVTKAVDEFIKIKAHEVEVVAIKGSQFILKKLK